MNPENGQAINLDEVPKNALDESGNVHTGAMIDASEELNFRLSAFLRAYLGKEHDVHSVISRARILKDHCTDFATLLSVYCNHHEK